VDARAVPGKDEVAIITGMLSPRSWSTISDFDAARQAGKKAEALLRQMAGLVSGEKT
jgi:hypothetical protein